jgi:hypothetical protein
MWRLLALSLGLLLLAALLIHVAALHLRAGAGVLNEPSVSQTAQMHGLPIQPGPMLDRAAMAASAKAESRGWTV